VIGFLASGVKAVLAFLSWLTDWEQRKAGAQQQEIADDRKVQSDEAAAQQARDRAAADPDYARPITNITFGVKVLDWLTADLEKHGIYSVENLAAAFNAGIGHVLGGGTDKPYSDKIIAAYEKLQAVLV